ncbi:tRNA 5-methoxyuridine(34)/uridine 5-oxyacetic acid(34) synthase CmoB [Sulfurospirillum sp. hDNRA2]|uniref:tRNA 5-methoxyuridine(34)/uridine 5-oxyacetic acid(34) synthase CmoB n=1 Tax=Sulfurospirillum sp. hDNRA2 TaxID=3237298 RepID=UPI0020B72B32|nr:tRNA 5-methoxyuridine(34)/uridine 5-oxyacetic acid(34) synthase CmoB [Sulfurospirillum sp. DNRA8]MCP3651037.1 tRNA 5-methoxyuridine(34)/uridine 5-oxyacetic acid(34) synthase CmoB [Sulfurospirillum sp. DNRA8]MCR1809883.1 tRNA 5-methoxyuridine(34)/uridine 5-oxyacetic acid(34) synthase CmoB [Sulfurospirillum sp. DNRA8]
MSSLDTIRQERLAWLEWKDIKPMREALSSLPQFKNLHVTLEDCIHVDDASVSSAVRNLVHECAQKLMPWRKGPFRLFDTFIDTEWQSFIKYNLLEPHFDLSDKIVGDIGCNNGYYLFRMLTQKPKKLVGFDPSALYKTQFDFINRFVQSDIVYEMLGVEHLPLYEHRFDTLFCLGVLYHRSDPIQTLKALYQGLNQGGELFLDTFMIEGESPVALCPAQTYSKIPNVYFVPTVQALFNWLERAKFKDAEVLEIKVTDTNEQRKTEWIFGESLEHFLDPKDPSRTIEGYPAPKRVYVKAKR